MNFIESQTADKLRGGYYTPDDLARYLCRWIATRTPARILEPSCGDGAFFRALSGPAADAEIIGFELHADEAAKARAAATALPRAQVIDGDFLEWAVGQLERGEQSFDAVIGNPPFIRYQYLPEHFQRCSEAIFTLTQLKFTKHTNAWVPFVIAGLSLLRPGGRLAMVLPAEIIHVAHAQSLRGFLARQCSRLMIVDPEEIWFESTLQGAVLLLAEKKRHPDDHSDGLGILAVKGRSFLDSHPEDAFDRVARMNGKTVAGKWTQALLTNGERDTIAALSQLPGVARFADIAEVDVGIVTGANAFFLVPDEIVERYNLQRWVHPMFGRSNHCPGIVYDARQHQENAAKGNPTNFVWIPPGHPALSAEVLAYLRLGEQQKLHTRYKCRIRSPWYSVPSVYATEIGMLKRAHDAPRLIRNTLGAFTTDTAYRISAAKVPADRLVQGFINPLTALSAELEGRHYGGGVLELVPSEIERLLVPVPAEPDVDLPALDAAIRAQPMTSVMAGFGTATLRQTGASPAEIDAVLAAWDRLRNRRQRNSGEADEGG